MRQVAGAALDWHGLRAGHLLAALWRGKVDFVVFGSVARSLRGDRSRTPADLDVAPEHSDENLERLAVCLNEVGAYGDLVPLVATAVNAAALRDFGNAHAFRTWFGRIELCLRVGSTDTFSDLRPSATAILVDGCEVLVASQQDLDRLDAARQ